MTSEDAVSANRHKETVAIGDAVRIKLTAGVLVESPSAAAAAERPRLCSRGDTTRKRRAGAIGKAAHSRIAFGLSNVAVESGGACRY